MTAEEVRALKVGDIVWMLCRDEEPGTAVKCEVTKPVDEYELVTIKCVGNPDCQGHRPWHGDISKTEVEVYEKAISRAESSIESNKGLIDAFLADNAEKKAGIEGLKAKLQKAKEEEVCWITDSGEVRKVRKSDYPCYIHYSTDHEAYIALARYYEAKLVETEARLEEVRNRLSNIPVILKSDEEEKE